MAKLLALIDGSIYSQSVCEHAAWVAKQTGAGIEVLHVLGRRDISSVPANLSGNLSVDARDTLLAELVSLDEQKAKLAQKRGRVLLADAKDRLSEAGICEVVTTLRNGDLIDTLAEYEADADLVILGKRGEAADMATLHLGSNLERVARSSKRPVLVASRAFKPIGRFLIAYDGGDSAQKAVEYAARSPIFKGLECHILTVGAETSEMREGLEKAGSLLRQAGLSVRTDIRPGQPEIVIAQAVDTESIDLLLIGAYGHSRIRSLIIGSTTTEMIRSCLIPIMLFR
ncbi:MAG: universal stress protein [Hyphomicrobiales bacterium]|nr:universal stress protein [Hyphomicrobiales bacterium]